MRVLFQGVVQRPFDIDIPPVKSVILIDDLITDETNEDSRISECRGCHTITLSMFSERPRRCSGPVTIDNFLSRKRLSIAKKAMKLVNAEGGCSFRIIHDTRSIIRRGRSSSFSYHDLPHGFGRTNCLVLKLVAFQGKYEAATAAITRTVTCSNGTPIPAVDIIDHIAIATSMAAEKQMMHHVFLVGTCFGKLTQRVNILGPTQPLAKIVGISNVAARVIAEEGKQNVPTSTRRQ
mmetsp:Transcript_23255/g.51543  ORF Transcript_23255/g.51543 Transcript_23255/m.51543 type:complete len:235 (+) Transcript_23255:692-1396(+)